MSQKLPVNGFKWVNKVSKLNESFIKGYNENGDRGYFLEVDVEYVKNLFNLHKDLSFLSERKKSKNVISLFATYKTKKNMLFTEQALNHGLLLKKVHGVIQFNQKAWLRPYININTELKKATNEFEKDFFQLVNNFVFGKTT